MSKLNQSVSTLKKQNNMATFDRYSYRYNEFGNRRSEEELNELEKQFNQNQQLKFKKMFKTIGAAVVGFFLLVFLFMSCERIDAGHVGVKVNPSNQDQDE